MSARGPFGTATKNRAPVLSLSFPATTQPAGATEHMMRDGGIAAAPQEWRSISAGRSVPTIRVRGACAWLSYYYNAIYWPSGLV